MVKAKKTKTKEMTLRADPEFSRRLRFIALQRDEDLNPLLIEEAIKPWLEKMEAKYGRVPPILRNDTQKRGEGA